jgi:hypothetical protein
MTKTISPCPDPVHRLNDLIGQDAINEWLEDGAPNRFLATVMAALDMPCHLHGDAVRLMCEAGWIPRGHREAIANPCQTIHAFAAVACQTFGIDLSEDT